MRTRRWIFGFILCALQLGVGNPMGWSAPRDDGTPSATQVVVRGKKVFADALPAAASSAWAGAAPRPVLLVFDVTPHTQRSRGMILQGLSALPAKARNVPSWCVAALGQKPSSPVPSAEGLVPLLDRVLAEETPVISTLTSLRKTLKAWPAKEGVVVYMADWHFEDDVDLEGFIKSLCSRKRTLSVIGTEAAFRRGWNDGLRDQTERVEMNARGIAFKDYWEGVGRNPFGGKDREAPWHGGETAYPIAPYRWTYSLWSSSFSLSDWDLAELDKELETLREGADEREVIHERLDALLEELEGLDQQLAAPNLGDARRAELKARVEALEREHEELTRELLKSFGGDIAADVGRTERLEELCEQAQELDARIGDLLEQSLEARDAAEEARLEAECERLQLERDGLTDEIRMLRAKLAGSETSDEVSRGFPPPSEDELDPEDLRGRLPDGAVPEELERPEWIDTDNVIRKFPLPSSFGPYGLMRAAGVTGGRYVLFSWNPSGRKTVVYEYSRCNLFPPDLRPRKAILADVRRNPWARSVLAAWWALIDARVDVLEQLPPVRANLRSACPMNRADHSVHMPRLWDSPGDQRLCLRHAAKAIEALDRALELLDEGLAQGGEPSTDVEQRYHAEALLFRHAVRVARFELRETEAVARDVPRSAFRAKKESPGVSDEPWVRQGRDAENVRTWPTVKPRDIEEGAAIVEERRRYLERFRGTPLGEQLAMNTVDTCRPTAWEGTDTGPDSRRSPTESTDMPTPTPPPPGGTSGPGGPATGGD